MHYLNIAAYKFVGLEPTMLIVLREQLQKEAQDSAIKGSILLSQEGINLFLAGEPEGIEAFMDTLHRIPAFTDLEFKISKSAEIPYKRLLVRIKKEIITFKQAEILPEKQTASYIEPEKLKEWYNQDVAMIVLDTRNNYEFEVGSFADAIHLDIENFTDFPEALAKLPESAKSQVIVTFCTGGIRCEKATAYMIKQGFKNVWQLKGGILNYFAKCGDEYFKGNCFVFDNRNLLNSNLEEVAGSNNE